MDNRFVRRLLTVVGARIALELRGVKCLPFEQSSIKKHIITCSRSFGRTITNYESIKERFCIILTRACEKMRKNNLAAHAITVFYWHRQVQTNSKALLKFGNLQFNLSNRQQSRNSGMDN
jgi:hypothetical protein